MSDLENGKSMSHFMCSILSSDIWHLKKSSGSMRIISICIVRPCRRGYESILVACKFMSRYKFGFISTWDENIFQCFYMDDQRGLLPLTQKEQAVAWDSFNWGVSGHSMCYLHDLHGILNVTHGIVA